MTHSKKNRSLSFTLVIVMLTIFTSLQSSTCSKSDDIATINAAPIAGSWRVSYYWDKKDETNNFAGYNFSFNANGQISATNGTNTITGAWSQTSSRFVVNFGNTLIFSDINGDWQIVEKTANSIKLKDDNPLQDDQITFTKN
ncbi:MAG: hypothetical protein ABL929_11955 [Ferruginibacter sp.]|nr:hypothetical protein [Ferruginibacter sp.]